MGPNPREGETTGELSEELITENGEPKILVGLLEAELLGCCEDMACKLPAEENNVPSEGCQSKVTRKGNYELHTMFLLKTNITFEVKGRILSFI